MTMRATLPLVAVVDDDEPFLVLMYEVFTMEGYDVVTARHPTDAFALLRNTPPDLMLLDLAFDRTRIAGLTLLRSIRADYQSLMLPVIVTSAATDLLVMYEAEFAALNAATLAKPFDLSDLINLAGVLIPGGACERRERTHE